MAREHLVLTKLYCHDNCPTHKRKHLVLMKSTYLTLSGSVRNEVGNLDLLGTTIGKITGSQPGIAFLPSVLLVKYLSEVISHYYAAHWLSFAVIVYHFLSSEEGIIEVPSFNDGNCFVRLITTQ